MKLKLAIRGQLTQEQSMKYNVHLYTQVRIKVTGIEANNPAEAMKLVADALDYHRLLDDAAPIIDMSLPGDSLVQYVEWAEGQPDGACVDPLLDNGEIDYDNTAWLDGEGRPARNDDKGNLVAIAQEEGCAA